MKSSIIYRGLSILALSVMMYSCGNSPTITDEDSNLSAKDTINEELNAIITQFKMPSPVEVFIFLWEDITPFYKEALNPVENSSKYTTTIKKAVNLGIYASDVAYSSVNDKNQLTMNYFAVSKKIADDLGLSKGFDDKFLERVTKNISNADSLYQITTDSYTEATQYLQNNGQTHLLPYITFGGWLESVHIIISSTKTYSANAKTIQLLNDQGVLLENLVDYYKSINNKAEINDIYKDLENLQSIYDKSAENEINIISKAQYNEIKIKIEEIRNKWTK